MEAGKRLSTTEMIACGRLKWQIPKGSRELSHPDGAQEGLSRPLPSLAFSAKSLGEGEQITSFLYFRMLWSI